MSLPLRILVADDHGPFRTLLKSFLATHGAEVIESADGQEALRQFNKLEPDWVLMDLEMPGLDGLATTRLLTASNPKARVIIVTQHDDAQLRAAAREAGACGFVPKDDIELLTPILFPPRKDTQPLSTKSTQSTL